MSKILITGVAGLVGSNLAKSLMSSHEVIGVDNLVGGYEDNIPYGIKFINKDCSTLSTEDFNGVDIVVHAACLAHEGLSIFSPKVITDSVFGMSMNVLTASISAGVKKFIYMSSMARYGIQEQIPFTESMIPKPQDPYGIAKYAFEEVLKVLSEVHGIDYSIVVPHNIIGPGQVYNDPFRNVAGIMINRMLQDKQPIIYGNGLQMRCFSDIKDVISPLIKIIETDIANKEIINIGPDDNFITIKELADKIASILRFDLDPLFFPDRPKEVRFANCSADKARVLLGYKPSSTLDNTLNDMIQFIKDRGPQDFNFYIPLEIINSLTPKTWTDHTVFNS
jgi:UDP-glucose 4-epimerase